MINNCFVLRKVIHGFLIQLIYEVYNVQDIGYVYNIYKVNLEEKKDCR